MITKRNYDVLVSLIGLVAKTRRHPTLHRIATAAGISHVAVRYNLLALQRAGLVEYMPGQCRGTRILRLPDLSEVAT